MIARTGTNGHSNATDNPATTTGNPSTDAAATADPTHTTHYLWDGNRLLMEVQGSRSRTWVYPLCVKLLHYHTDHLGTPRELTDPDGNLLWAASYQAWGNTRSIDYPDLYDKAQRTAYPQPPEDLARLPLETIRDRRDSLAAAYRSQWRDDYDQPLRFQGQYYDAETGLHYNRFRYYDPDMGRFTTQDPIGLLGGNNLYQYAPNPTAWVDPLGLIFGSGKGKHTAKVTITDSSGNLKSSEVFTSGNMTPNEKALGFPKSTLATHTENRAMRESDIAQGDSVLIEGEYPPCKSCKGAMNNKAKDVGADVEYTWPDESGKVQTWKANKK